MKVDQKKARPASFCVCLSIPCVCLCVMQLDQISIETKPTSLTFKQRPTYISTYSFRPQFIQEFKAFFFPSDKGQLGKTS